MISVPRGYTVIGQHVKVRFFWQIREKAICIARRTGVARARVA